MDPQYIDVVVMDEEEISFRHFEQAVKQCGTPIRLFRATDIGQLQAYLTCPNSAPAEHFKPDLVFLELKPPPSAGFEFLETRWQRLDIRKIPVLALLSGWDKDQVTQAYALGANSVISKPTCPEGYRALMDMVKRYWFGIVKLPTRS